MNLIQLKAGKTLYRLLIIGVFLLNGSLVFAQHQPVNLTGANLSLKAAFKQIEQQTNLFVDYNVRDVNDSRVIKELPKASNVKSVLEQLLAGSDCVVTFNNGHAIIAKKVNVSSAPKKVKGIVKDQKGEPVIGANVVEKGTANGTVTDLDGNYNLSVSEGSV